MKSLRAVLLFVLVIVTQGAAQTSVQHRQAYLGLIYYVRPADAAKFEQSNRQYSAALASHGISNSLLRWTAYTDGSTYTYLWLYPIGHLNDIERLSDAESKIDERITNEHWKAGSDLHFAVDHTQEFVIRDEPTLSRLPSDLEAWTQQACEFQLYYTFGAYGGSDSQVRRAWSDYRSAFPQDDNHYYRVLRVLIGLERPLWVVQHCGSSLRDITQQKSGELKASGTVGGEAQRTLFKYVRKVEVWHYEFDPDVSYPLPPTANRR